ncbi:MAG: radical SAM protein [Desulfobulbus sp.]|nr:radical SAM protein [Desulfobulbus sp.]
MLERVKKLNFADAAQGEPGKPLVIPVFIPHEGCPHCCIFCNQHQISGQGETPISAEEVGQTIQTWLEHRRSSKRHQVQVAFYGGSFTGLPLARQQALLAVVQPYLQKGLVQEIRLSTRPDYIDAQRLQLLCANQVGIVELGVQSCDDQLLQLAGRGHSAGDTIRAAHLIKGAGLQLGIQLMLGLPGQSFASLRRTVDQVIALQPDLVRLYPLLVLKGSGLESLYHRGVFRPLSLSRAVLQAAYMKKRFDDQGITVVRMGLQPGPELEHSLVAGPYHPAFGEMVKARLMLQKTRRALARLPAGKSVHVVINDRDQSIFRGLHSQNLNRLQQLGLLDRFNLRTDSNQPRQTVRLLEELNNL